MEKVWVFTHIVGTVLGAGSVTTAYLRDIYYQLHPEDIKNKGSLKIVSLLLNTGFALIIISGFGLYMSNPQKYNNSPLFLLKIGLVVLLLINHVAINAFIRDKKDSLKVLNTISEYFSLLGWYAIIAVSILL